MARPPLTPKQVARIWRARGVEKKTVRQTAEALNVSPETIRKYCNDRTTETLRLALEAPEDAQQKTPA